LKKGDRSLVDIRRNELIVTTVENFDKHENSDCYISDGNTTLDDNIDNELVLSQVIQ